MCGICGKLSWRCPPDRNLIEKMTRSLIHRGPDMEGVYFDTSIGLGHRRLSVIDTSDSGRQPMSDSTGLFWIVFNGEIYNYRKIRENLQRLRVRFGTNTDTEVVLESFKMWGVKCLDHLNGMFAFAIWDKKEQTLLLARDRLGKKPLFYKPLPGGGLVFASELKALRHDPEVGSEWNMKAVSHYLSLNYTLTAEPIIQGVRKLEAAHYLLSDKRGSGKEIRYWDLAKKFQTKTSFSSEEEAGEALSELIDDSVRLRMVSDVPLGAFLSGGIDSSCITAALCRERKPKENKTFSIGFREKTYSELEYARSMGEFLGSDHYGKTVDADIASILPEIVYYADEPFADTSIIPTYILAEYARQYVTVCLSGDGGDEMFAGYETYAADKIHHMTKWIPGWCATGLEKMMDVILPVSYGKVSTDYKLRKFLKGHSHSDAQAHYSWRTIFSDEEKDEILLSEYRDDSEEGDPYIHFKKYWDEPEGCHYLDRAMYVDIKTWLTDDILVKVDRATMAHSLEVRCPLLDYRIVEFAASLPVSMKMKFFRKKHILRLSQKNFLPPAVLSRRKQGFNAPVSHWLTSSMGLFYMKMMDDPELWFNKEMMRTMYDEHKVGRRDNSLKLFSLISFYLWINNGNKIP